MIKGAFRNYLYIIRYTNSNTSLYEGGVILFSQNHNTAKWGNKWAKSQNKSSSPKPTMNPVNLGKGA